MPGHSQESAPSLEGEWQEISGARLLAWRRQQLEAGGRAADLDWLLDLGAGVAWQDLQLVLLRPEKPVQLRKSLRQLGELWGAHLQTAVPLQYLVGRAPWRDLDLAVAPGVLIPRQETELLVDLALTLFTPGLEKGQAPVWADLGTGSGCLAIALAAAFPGGQGFAVETSEEARRIARLNLSRAGAEVRVQLLAGDWWEPLEPWWGRLQLVVANPPYVPSATVRALEPTVRDHEPLQALDGGVDGLDAIRFIVAGAEEALAPGGLLLLEHHHDQSRAVLELLEQAGLTRIQAHRDLEGILRFASARRSWRDSSPP
jgi:release factor glutamine methyltransferase